MWRARRGPALLSAPAPPPPRAAVHDARPHPAPRRRRDVFPGKLLLEPCKALLHLLGLPENPLHILHSASSVSSAPSSGSRSSASAGWGIGALRGAGRTSRTAAPSNSRRTSASRGSDSAFFSGPLPPPDDPSGLHQHGPLVLLPEAVQLHLVRAGDDHLAALEPSPHLVKERHEEGLFPLLEGAPDPLPDVPLRLAGFLLRRAGFGGQRGARVPARPSRFPLRDSRGGRVGGRTPPG